MTSADQACMLVFDGTENPVGLLTNSATVSFAYKYDPWGVQTLTAGGTGNGMDPSGNSPGSDVCYTEFLLTGLLVSGAIALAGLPTAGAAWAVGAIAEIALYEGAKAACG